MLRSPLTQTPVFFGAPVSKQHRTVGGTFQCVYVLITADCLVPQECACAHTQRNPQTQINRQKSTQTHVCVYIQTGRHTQNNTLIEKPKDTHTTSTSYTSHKTPRQTHLLTHVHSDVYLYIGTIKDTAHPSPAYKRSQRYTLFKKKKKLGKGLFLSFFFLFF